MCFGAKEFSGNGTAVAKKPVLATILHNKPVSDLPVGQSVQVFHKTHDNLTYIATRKGIFFVSPSGDGFVSTIGRSTDYASVAALVADTDVKELSTYAAPIAGDDDDADEDVDEPFTNMSTEEFALINAEIFNDAGIANNSRDVNLVMAATAAVINRIQDVVPLLGQLLSPESLRDTSPVSVTSAIVELILVAVEENKTNELTAAAMEAVAELEASRVPASSYGN